jgi:hypothetical protein
VTRALTFVPNAIRSSPASKSLLTQADALTDLKSVSTLVRNKFFSVIIIVDEKTVLIF